MKNLMILMSMALPAMAIAAPAVQVGEYTIDAAHTKVGFEIPHLVISTVEGRFNQFQGTIKLGDKAKDLSIDASIDVASIDTGIKDRDDHLKSPDFFDAAKFQKITFKSTKVEGVLDAFTITGDLTIHGVTKPVKLSGKYLGAVNDPYGNTKAAFVASGKIKRKDFGLTWNKLVEAGPVVGDEISLTLKVEAAKNKVVAK